MRGQLAVVERVKPPSAAKRLVSKYQVSRCDVTLVFIAILSAAVANLKRWAITAQLTARHMPTLVQLFGKIRKMQTELLKVSGMTCGGCTSKVTHALKAVSGVGDVKVSLPAGEATVQYDEQMTSPDQLKAAVTGAGYSVDATNADHTHRSKGGCCN